MNNANDPSTATTTPATSTPGKEAPGRRRSSRRRKKQPSDLGRELCEGDVTTETTSETMNHGEEVSIQEVVQAPPPPLTSPEDTASEQHPKSRTEVLADWGVQRISTMPLWIAFDMKDLKVTTQQEQTTRDIAAQAQQSMRRVLTSRFQNQVPTADTVIHIRLLQCSKGNRRTRMWCGEVGLGWMVVEVAWTLSKGKHLLTPTPRRVKHYHSAGQGWYDFCDRNYGERTLLHDLCVKAATEIKNDVTHILLRTEKF